MDCPSINSSMKFKFKTVLQNLPNKAWCVLKSHRLLAGESPVLVRVRPPDSRQPMQPGDWLCRSVVTPWEREAKQQPVT